MLAFEFALRLHQAIVVGPLHHVAQGAEAARDDRDFVDRIGIRQRAGDQGMAAFVVGDAQLFFWLHDAAFLFEADALRSTASLKSAIVTASATLAGGEQGGFVDHVRQIGPDANRGVKWRRARTSTSRIEL